MSETFASIEQLLTQHRRIAIDSNVLIYLTEGGGSRADAAAMLVDAVVSGRTEGVLSSAALSEVLVGPARSGDGVAFELLAATIRDLGLRIVALDAAAAEDAAWIRGQSGLPLPDAIHLACAIAAGATVLVTNDRDIRPRPRLDVAYLDDLVA